MEGTIETNLVSMDQSRYHLGVVHQCVRVESNECVGSAVVVEAGRHFHV